MPPGLCSRAAPQGKAGVRSFGAVALILFGGGGCYFLILPVVLQVIFRIGDCIHIQTDFVATVDYLVFCLYFLLGFGLAFEVAVVVVMLVYLGLSITSQLQAGRSWRVVAILIVAMVLTPPDVISQCVMAVPMIALFEASIWIVRMKERSRKPLHE